MENCWNYPAWHHGRIIFVFSAQSRYLFSFYSHSLLCFSHSFFFQYFSSYMFFYFVVLFYFIFFQYFYLLCFSILLLFLWYVSHTNNNKLIFIVLMFIAPFTHWAFLVRDSWLWLENSDRLLVDLLSRRNQNFPVKKNI